MSDIYADDNQDVMQGSEIGESGSGVFAPDAHGLARLDLTHHHDASHGLPDTTVIIAEDSSGLPLSCSHGGVSYGSGETAVIPAAVARFWVRSGWATSDLAQDAEGLSAPQDEPKRSPPVKSPSKQTAAGTRRRG